MQVGFSLTNMDQSFLGALQSVAALIWMALVFLVKGVLLLLEWGFSIDLLGVAMTDVRRTLVTLHERVIGEPWFLAALSVAALWGIWRGLVQRKAASTITGLGVTVGLMVVALVILSNPAGTVGYASKLSNDASLGVLSAATTRDLDRPADALSASMLGVFDSMVRDPWCALEFGSVDWCHARARGTRRLSNGDVWLSFPAGSDERKALYKLLKGEEPDGGGGILDFVTKPAKPLLDVIGLGGGKAPHVPDEVRALVPKNPERAAIQEAGGTFPRFALLAVIAIGITGAVALLAYLGLLAAMLALLLLLFAPAMLLAPAFGESGRATFIAWGKRLVGALAAKLIYAFFLAVVLAANATITKLGIGWFGIWLLHIAFWWGVLLKRKQLIGFVSAGAPGAPNTEGGGDLLARTYYALQVGRGAMQGVGRAAALPRAARQGLGQRQLERGATRGAAVEGLAREQLDGAAAQALVAEHAQAQAAVAYRPLLERELRAVNRRLAGYDETRAAARARNAAAPEPTEDQQALIAHRRRLEEQLAAPELRHAEQVVAHRDRNQARTGAAVTSSDLEDWRERRREDLSRGLPIEHERNLRAAGVDPQRYHDATGQERLMMRGQVEAWLQRERALLAATSPDADRSAIDHAARHFSSAEVRTRRAQEHAKLRAERRQRRARDNLFRPS